MPRPEDDRSVEASRRFALDEAPELLRAAQVELTGVERVTTTSTLRPRWFRPTIDERRVERTPLGEAWLLGAAAWPAIAAEQPDGSWWEAVEVTVALRPVRFPVVGAPHPRVVLLRPGTSAVLRPTEVTTYDAAWAELDDGSGETSTAHGSTAAGADQARLWLLVADLARRRLGRDPVGPVP